MLHQPRPFLNHAGGGVGKIYALKKYDRFFILKISWNLNLQKKAAIVADRVLFCFFPVGGGLVNHAGFPPPTPAQFLAPNSNMRLRAGEQQVFVSVAYDFEYLAEDGKRVFMKENEILLLINKTNHDWWQVIIIN